MCQPDSLIGQALILPHHALGPFHPLLTTLGSVRDGLVLPARQPFASEANLHCCATHKHL